jgi:hypothetical protein
MSGVRGVLVTEQGVIAHVVVRGNSFEIIDGSIRKSTEAQRPAEALARVDGTDDSALARL